MKRTAIITVLFICLFTALSPAREMSGVPSFIRTPQDLAAWLADEFEYRMEIPDRWQDVSETISSRQGDCEDFAVLSSVVLQNLGISNDVVIVEFRDLKISHALCVWEDTDGTYSFISNKKIYYSGETELARAVQKFYPDWCKMVFTDHRKNPLKTVKR